jgi:hypothetical protein
MIKHLQSLPVVAALCLGMSFPSFAQDITPKLVGAQPIIGTIESIKGSVMTIQTLKGERQTFLIQPSLVQIFKLAPGTRITIDGSRLKIGTVKRLDANTMDVLLDGGNITTLVISGEALGGVSQNDRVVITPNGKVVRADRYKLSAGDIRLR